MSERSELIVKALLDRCGRTYAEEAGIRLADRPGPLYQLLVLATLLSARISADIAVAAARELFAAGYRSPKAMSEASWQERVDALGRGHYRRYDERTATMLGDGADLLSSRWHGDLRRLRDEGRRGHRPDRVAADRIPRPGTHRGQHLPARGPGRLACRGSLRGREGDQRCGPGGAAGQRSRAGPDSVQRRSACSGRRRPGPGVDEPAGRQRSHRRGARLRPRCPSKRVKRPGEQDRAGCRALTVPDGIVRD